MAPLLRDNDMLSIKPAPAAGVGFGQIALIRSGDVVVAHRIVGIKELDGQRIYLEKGDNVMSLTLVEPGRILARVVGVQFDGQRQVDLLRWHWRAVGCLTAWHGRIALRCFRLSRGLVRRFGGSERAWPFCRSVVFFALHLPSRLGLRVARRVLP